MRAPLSSPNAPVGDPITYSPDNLHWMTKGFAPGGIRTEREKEGGFLQHCLFIET